MRRPKKQNIYNRQSGAMTVKVAQLGYETNLPTPQENEGPVNSGPSIGQIQLFPQQQIEQEYAAVDQMDQTAYSNALQNFLTLSQQADSASPGGQTAGSSTYTDQARFVGDNGLISTGFNANFTLTQT